MKRLICEHFRCPEQYVSFHLRGHLSKDRGYFKFGRNILFGRISGGPTSRSPKGSLDDMLPASTAENQTVYLPFDVTEILEGMRNEVYHTCVSGHHPGSSVAGKTYYFFRPFLPVSFRKHLQRIRLKGWHDLEFPNWPVDCTVDNTLEDLLLLSLRASGRDKIPFIWFWPDGASSCAIMTHDVETTAGRDFCGTLMDIDDSFGIKASLQVVPERRYEVPDSYLESIRGRGFEVNVQDLNHDGQLFREREEFVSRATKINAYRRQFQAEGFRSAILYRRQEWYGWLDFSYDMSVPNVAHLDPQRGGCCTVMPYFIGKMIELPVTMTQDYSLFHILEESSIDLWKRQSELVMGKHGLMNLIVHPDYIIDETKEATYKNLLRYLAQLREERAVWMPLPREVASWWRARSEMRLEEVNGTWQVEGPGKERARIAYASEKDGQLVYSFEVDKLATQTTQMNKAHCC